MARTLRGKVVAIPIATTATGAAVAKLVAAERGNLVLGVAKAAQSRAIAAQIQNEDIAIPIQVNLERPNSVDEFFKIAIGQFGHIDAVVIETVKTSDRAALTEKSIGLAARRFLYCLDSALQYCNGDLHVINIAPVAGRYAIPVATALLGAKLATGKLAKGVAPSLRMSVVSPFSNGDFDDGTLARTVAHVLREARIPDVTESVFWKQCQPAERASRSETGRLKLMVPM